MEINIPHSVLLLLISGIKGRPKPVQYKISAWGVRGILCHRADIAELTALGGISSESTVLEAEGFLPTDVDRVSFRGARNLPPLGSGFSLL